MKNSNVVITEIESDVDVKSYRDSTGFVLSPGNFVVHGILNDTPEGIRIFQTREDALAYIAEKVCGTEKKPVKRAKKGAKAVSTKKPKAKKAKKSK